jgi:alanyl-tRNA synthetase
LVKVAAAALGGSGGGRDDVAQGGGAAADGNGAELTARVTGSLAEVERAIAAAAPHAATRT